jgi:hypothetical protein
MTLKNLKKEWFLIIMMNMIFFLKTILPKEENNER